MMRNRAQHERVDLFKGHAVERAEDVVENPEKDRARHAEQGNGNRHRAEGVEHRLPAVRRGKTDADAADDAEVRAQGGGQHAVEQQKERAATAACGEHEHHQTCQ